ncbi:hypothetical protein GCM10023075_07990 [Streptosporangium album]
MTPGIYRPLGCAVIVASTLALTPTAAYAASSVDVALPDTRVTVRESSTDPFTITSYTLGNSAYLRRSTGFVKQIGYQEVTVAPKGTMALAVPTSYSAGHDSVLLADLAANKASKIQTVAKPSIAKFAHWSRSGTKAVLTVQGRNGTLWETTGFVIVDATAKTARTVIVKGVDRAARFRWSPDGVYVVADYQGGTRFYDQAGVVRRALAKTGIPAGGEDAFAPSARTFMTWCPASYTEYVCFWDRATGKLAGKADVKPKALLGWWDDKHIIAVMASGNAYRVAVLDLQGKATRVLADISAEDWKNKVYLSYTRR